MTTADSAPAEFTTPTGSLPAVAVGMGVVELFTGATGWSVGGWAS